MTQLTLTKHHGLGNDFLVVFSPCVDDLPALARQLCDRRRGIGADGLLVAESADGFAARMTLYNADGSRAEMSGNGIRCFAQALAPWPPISGEEYSDKIWTREIASFIETVQSRQTLIEETAS